MDILILFALTLSLKVHELYVIPQFKALNISFSHFKVNFGCRIENFGARKQQMCLIFLVQTLLEVFTTFEYDWVVEISTKISWRL